ncbi:MAG: hypothetical protein J6C61_08995 [Clostridia bacterium]|nr:hypothetical protein [Clostridia bacterium]
MENKRKKHSAFDRVSAWLLNVLLKSPIGKMFTSYDKINDSFQKITKNKSKNRHTPRKKTLERAIEDNVFSNVIPKIFNYLLRVATRSYAIIFFVMSIVVFLLYFLNGRTVLIEIDVPLKSFISATAVMLVSFPFLFSSKSLAGTLTTNKLFSYLAFNFLGIDNEAPYQIAKRKKSSGTTLAFFIGFSAGILAYFISPLFVVAIALIIFFAYVVFRTPEVGIILVILTLPLVDPIITKISLVYIFVAYAVKVILRKRVFTFEYLDMWALILTLAFTICGIDYQNIIGSLSIVISNLTIFLAYFVISNLIRSKEWFQRCIAALTTSGLVVAGVALTQFILGILSTSNPELVIFEEYRHSISSTFNDNEIFAQFMVVTVPFALVHMFTQKRDISKFADFVISIALIGSLFLSGSPYALLGVLVGALLLLVIHNRNFIYFAIVVIAGIVGVVVLAIENQDVNAFLTSTSLFVNFDPLLKLSEIWQGIKDIVVWPQIFGKGAGSSVPGVDSFFVQLTHEYGIIALSIFIAFAVVFSTLIFTYCAKTSSKNRKSNSSVGLCAMVGLLVTGVFSNIWADEKIMLLSIACVALSFAFIKIEKERVHSSSLEKNELNKASIEIEISDSDQHEYVASRKYVRAPKRMITVKKQNQAPVLDNTGIMYLPKTTEKEEIEDDDIEDINRV